MNLIPELQKLQKARNKIKEALIEKGYEDISNDVRTYAPIIKSIGKGLPKQSDSIELSFTEVEVRKEDPWGGTNWVTLNMSTYERYDVTDCFWCLEGDYYDQELPFIYSRPYERGSFYIIASKNVEPGLYNCSAYIVITMEYGDRFYNTVPFTINIVE